MLLTVSACGNGSENTSGNKDTATESENNTTASENATSESDAKYIKFGAYEQDNDKTNGKEEIEWLVLDIQDGKALVISRYGLDCQKYNTEDVDVTWETCSLRIWLNETFINNAFTAEEQAKIQITTVTADKNPIPYFETKPGKDTQDKIFLLSIVEAEKYFADNESRKCGATDYAHLQGATTNNSISVDGYNTCIWWLRTPGNYQEYAGDVRSDGGVNRYGYRVRNKDRAVRPAMWITIED